MAATHHALAVLALGYALIASPAAAQQGSSVSLTHTLTVTVPPRVRVQVGSVPQSSQKSVAVSSVKGDALSLSVSATQSWMLSIGGSKSSDLQWSIDGGKSFADVTARQTTVASGEISPMPTASTLLFRSASARGGADRPSGGEDEVVLTVVAP